MQRFLRRAHDFHHLQARQDAVAGRCVLAEDDVPGLLAAQTAVVLRHVLVDVLVAHSGLGGCNAEVIQRAEQPQIAHHRRDDRVAQQLTRLLHVPSADEEDVVAGDFHARFVHAQAAVSVAVEGKAHVAVVFDDELLQAPDVRRTRIAVDVQPVRFGVDDQRRRPQRVENRLGDVPAGTVGAVQRNPPPAEGVQPQRNQVADIAVAPGHIVHRAANLLLMREGNFVPRLPEAFQMPVQVGFDKGNRVLIHLFALPVDELDAVVVVRVMAGGNHDAAVKAIEPRDERDGRGRRDMEKVRIRAGRGQPADERILEHIAGTAGILADDDARAGVVAIAALALAVVPAEKASHPVGMVSGQLLVRFSAESVRSEILAHGDCLLRIDFFWG